MLRRLLEKLTCYLSEQRRADPGLVWRGARTSPARPMIPWSAPTSGVDGHRAGVTGICRDFS